MSQAAAGVSAADGLSRRCLPRLQRETFNSAPAVVHSASGYVRIVFPLLIRRVAPADCESSRHPWLALSKRATTSTWVE
jgi:hypothetical protein